MSKQTLPERLREVAPVVEENFDVFTGELLTEAADEIERLEYQRVGYAQRAADAIAEIKRLRAVIASEVLRIDAGCDNLRAALGESSAKT